MDAPRQHLQNRQRRVRPASAIVVVRCATIVVASLIFFGCATEYVSLRKTPQNPLADQLKLFSKNGPTPSPRAMQVIRRFGLAGQLDTDVRGALTKLEQVYEQDPTAETGYAIAELAYLAAEKLRATNKGAALDLYGVAVTHSYHYLFEMRPGYQRNVFDPEFRGACDLYNTALEGALRLVVGKDGLKPGSIQQIETGTHHCEITVACRASDWRDDEFERFEFVSDYEVRGLTNQYHTFGLGVPLIGVRSKPETPSPAEKYYPPGLSLPVTAFLRVLPPDTSNGDSNPPLKAVLELYDPLTDQTIDVHGVRVPLESDLSAPLAYFLNKPVLSALPTIGLFNPDKYEGLQGLYMVQPFEPNKIPVLMVHGLWSSPITWMEMFNDLRSDPLVRSRYQFWFYLYPTGQPFWVSAAQLRRDLVEARHILDPQHSQPLLDQMVLVGHSMGGLVSEMQTIESGDAYWKTVSKEPFDLVKADQDVKTELAETFFFRANPSVRRVVTIGTPHRGSTFANDATRFLSRKLINMPKMLVQESQQLYRENPGAFDKDSPIHVPTSIDSLSPDCPILPVILDAPRPPGLKRHNIVGVVEKKSLLQRVSGRGDGVVGYESGHLDNIDSEIVVDADHMHVHRHPISVLEVRRVLLEHLNSIYMAPSPQMPRVYSAAVQVRPSAPPWTGPPTTSMPATPNFAGAVMPPQSSSMPPIGPSPTPNSNLIPPQSPTNSPSTAPLDQYPVLIAPGVSQ